MNIKTKINYFIAYMKNRNVSVRVEDTVIIVEECIFLDLYFIYRGRKAFDELIEEVYNGEVC